MSQTATIYRGTLHPCFRNEAGELRERMCDVIFTAESLEDACQALCRHTIHRFKTNNEFYTEHPWRYVGCMQLYEHPIHPIGADGTCRTGGAGRLMDWKCDMGLYTPRNPSPELTKLVGEVRALFSDQTPHPFAYPEAQPA